MTAPSAQRLPPWLKTRLPSGDEFARVRDLVRSKGLHTVCEGALCPNIAECWGKGTATCMILGDTCTRGCRFCSVPSAARPGSLSADEPQRLAQALAGLRLRYVVLTALCRDDLPDQGAGHVAECIRQVGAACPDTHLELLTQDFRGDRTLLKTVLDAGPDVLAHNLETVERLTSGVRDRRAGYRQSLKVLLNAKSLNSGVFTKSSLMLGLGETEAELVRSFADLRSVGVDFLTLGQYLRPTGNGRHLPVVEYVSPERFAYYQELAEGLGFLQVASGPFVRSSYHAAELLMDELIKNGSSRRTDRDGTGTYAPDLSNISGSTDRRSYQPYPCARRIPHD